MISQTPGYGTSWGTSFASGAGQYKSKSGFSKKALGLGVGAGFLGGAGLGVAGTLATYSVYHRYQVFHVVGKDSDAQFAGVPAIIGSEEQGTLLGLRLLLQLLFHQPGLKNVDPKSKLCVGSILGPPNY